MHEQKCKVRVADTGGVAAAEETLASAVRDNDSDGERFAHRLP